MSVIDLAFRVVVAELPGNQARGVAVDPALERAYVADRDKVSVIDMRAQRAIATAAYPTIGGTISLRPGQPEAYVITDHCSNTGIPCTADLSTVIRVFNTHSYALVDAFADNATTRIAFNADGSLMFVGRGAPSQLSILNAATRENLVTIPLLAPPLGMAVDAARGLLYVSESTNVAIVDIAARTLVARVPLPGIPGDLALAGGRLFASDALGNAVHVVDANARALVATIPVGQRPTGTDATPAGDRVVVANNASDTVSIIDAIALNVAGTVAVGRAPAAIGRFIAGSSAPVLPDTLTGLWFNPAEPGWGVHVAHRGTKIFAAWFTYDAKGAPVWYVAPDCAVNASGNGCAGDLYRTNGPVDPIHNPFDPSRVNVTKAGSISVSFSDGNSGTIGYTVDGRAGTKTIARQLF